MQRFSNRYLNDFQKFATKKGQNFVRKLAENRERIDQNSIEYLILKFGQFLVSIARPV